jgi:hypothetical protein
MNFKEAVVGVGLAGKKRLDFQLCDLGFQPLDLGFSVLNDRVVALHFAKLDQFDRVGDGLLEAFDGGNAGFKVLPLAHHGLRLLRIVPQVRILGARVQLVQVSECLIPVKDASSAVLWTASFRRQAVRFLPACGANPVLL